MLHVAGNDDVFLKTNQRYRHHKGPALCGMCFSCCFSLTPQSGTRCFMMFLDLQRIQRSKEETMEFQPWDKWRLWEDSRNRSEYGPDGRECQENSKQQSDCTFSSWIWDKRQVAIYLYKASRSGYYGYCIHGPCMSMLSRYPHPVFIPLPK